MNEIYGCVLTTFTCVDFPSDLKVPRQSSYVIEGPTVAVADEAAHPTRDITYLSKRGPRRAPSSFWETK